MPRILLLFRCSTGLWPQCRRKEKPIMAPVPSERDLRLDLFRGLALWLIFLDHIPSNAVSWITIRNYGFSDATEIFVFISGYTAAFVYGRAMRQHGFIVGAPASSSAPGRFMLRMSFCLRSTSPKSPISRIPSTTRSTREEMGVLDFLQAIPTSPSSRRCCSSSSRSTWTCCRSTSCCWSASRRCCGCCCARRRWR